MDFHKYLKILTLNFRLKVDYNSYQVFFFPNHIDIILNVFIVLVQNGVHGVSVAYMVDIQ